LRVEKRFGGEEKRFLVLGIDVFLKLYIVWKHKLECTGRIGVKCVFSRWMEAAFITFF
jgi:hypothetical protein